MRILVTGGAGYIGSHMVHALKDRGDEVFILDNLSTGVRANIPQDVEFFEGDVGDEAFVSNILTIHNIEAIAHFAGSIIVPESVAAPLDYYHNNTVKTRSLIACAVQCRVKSFIFSSTAAVYGMPEQNPVRENAALNPISPYGMSKLMSEIMLKDTAFAHDFHYGILRYFNVAGADPQGRTGQSTPKATHLIKVACQTALGQRAQLSLFGDDYDTEDGTCIRDYIHVSDLADAHILALDYLAKGGKSFIANCGYGKGFSVKQVIDAVKKVSGNDFDVETVDRRAGDPAALIAKTNHIHSLLDWKPRYNDLNVIVQHAWAWESKLSS